MAKATQTKIINPAQIDEGVVTLCLLGKTPLFYNAMSFKVRTELLMPRGRKTTAEKATQLKHDPYQEYRDSVYRRRDQDDGDTLLILPSRMCKAAVSDVAKRVPGGGTTAAIQQLVSMADENLDVWGIPQIHLGVVRNSDINRTPDIRTRAVLPHWACRVTLRYVQPQLTVDAIAKLVSAAGRLNGFGDFRQQKGDGHYGQFTIVSEDDERFQELLETQSREAQERGMDNPIPFDLETERLLAWYDSEIGKRRDEIAKYVSKKAEKEATPPADAEAAPKRTRKRAKA